MKNCTKITKVNLSAFVYRLFMNNVPACIFVPTIGEKSS